MSVEQVLARYDRSKSYQWNYDHAPDPIECEVPKIDGDWRFSGMAVDSPLGVPAGPLLNGRWCLYYASLGFDVLTYKTVRSRHRECYPLPNLQPVDCGALQGGESGIAATESMKGSWAVSYGMPSKEPAVWRADVEMTRRNLAGGKLLSVSVVASVQDGWTIDDLADDYAMCARWAIDSGADCVETNFSCPNVSTCDGQLYQNPNDAAIVVQRVREAIGTVPLICKVGRIAKRDDAESLLDAVGETADALAMTNSIATTVVGADGQFLFDGQKRGICGEATRQASVEQVRVLHEMIVRRGLDLQLIGVGGVSVADHVEQYIQAGAHAVHLATAAMVNPQVAIEIRRQLAAAPI